MTRNEDKYPKPDTFMPERFIDEHGNLNDDDMMLAFGFGRRSVVTLLICFYADSLLEFVPVDIWLLRL
jgi:hypothetical protein